MNIIQKIISLILTMLGLMKKKAEAEVVIPIETPRVYENKQPEVPEPKPIPLTKAEKIYKTALATLGEDISTLIENEIACSEVVSKIINQAISDFPAGVLSTADLNIKLKQSPYFRQVLEPSEGAIIVSPRTEKINGHTGICLSNGAIASNDSKTGKFNVNYNLETWAKTFGVKGRGLKIYIYEVI